jgi:hypothetical protein
MPVTMTVLREGYFDGAYPRAGDTITVEPGLVEQLEMAGFAMRCAVDAVPPRVAATQPTGRKHAR